MTEQQQHLGPLDLVVAAQPFLKSGKVPTASQRLQLRHAIYDFLRQRDAIPPAAVIGTPIEAISALQALIKRCDELKVDWTDVVAIVNREYIAPSTASAAS